MIDEKKTYSSDSSDHVQPKDVSSKTSGILEMSGNDFSIYAEHLKSTLEEIFSNKLSAIDRLTFIVFENYWH